MYGLLGMSTCPRSQLSFNQPSPIFFTSPTAVPSCFTPTVQHFPIGLEVIVWYL